MGKQYATTSEPNIPDDEAARRLAAVREAKARAGGRNLSDSELDQVVEPTPCRLTRLRNVGNGGRGDGGIFNHGAAENTEKDQSNQLTIN